MKQPCSASTVSEILTRTPGYKENKRGSYILVAYALVKEITVQPSKALWPKSYGRDVHAGLREREMNANSAVGLVSGRTCHKEEALNTVIW